MYYLYIFENIFIIIYYVQKNFTAYIFPLLKVLQKHRKHVYLVSPDPICFYGDQFAV